MEVKPGYKQTEVGVIPEEWEVKRLGEIATIATGNTPPTNDVSNYGEEYLFVGPVDMGDTKLIATTEKKLSKKGFAMSRRFPKHSILFVSIGSTIGKCGIAPVELTSNQQINAIFPSPAFSSDYLFYAICTAAPKIKAQAGEQAVPIVNKTQFSETAVALPPLPEQRAIATTLSDVDGLLVGLDRLIAKKRDLKQAAMQQLLTGQIRLPGFHGEWEVKRLDELGQCFAGGTPSTARPDYWGGSVLWLPSGKVQNNILREPSESETTITERGLAESAAKRIKPRSVLIAITGATCANVALLQFEAAANQSVVAIEPHKGAEARFIFYALLMERGQILSLQSGSAQGGVNLKTVKGIEVRCPQYEEQIAIAEVLTDMDAELTALEQRWEKTRALKQAMMQELLTGRTRLI